MADAKFNAGVRATPAIIAIVGAESTGKTQLAQGLAATLSQAHGLRCTWVSEWLREWCEREGRTPEPHEQAAIAQAQTRRIEQAALHHDVVLADTTALMTAVYSQWLFNDQSLHADALMQQRGYTLTLVTANDLPWEADGLQRDGPHVREPVRRLILDLLGQAEVPFEEVQGSGAERLADALIKVGRHLPLY